MRPVGWDGSPSGQWSFHSFSDSVAYAADISPDHRPREEDKTAAGSEPYPGFYRFFHLMLHRYSFLRNSGYRIKQGIPSILPKA